MITGLDKLRAAIKGSVITAEDAGYKNSIKRWSQAAIKLAAVVVQPNDTEEVSETVKYAVEGNIPFVVVSGGHATSGSSSSDGGMVIDLRRINHVHVDRAQKTVSFGGGCKWRDIDEACAKHGLATVGGTVNHTGVGGFILGGGFGWLTSKYGLTIDNLISAEVVLADGSIVIASEKDNPDLFWALRGAGQNFGVVTRFTLKVYEQGNVFAGPVIFTLDKLAGVVEFTNAFHTGNTGEESFWFGTAGALPDIPHPVVFCMIFKIGTKDDGERVFKQLLDLGPIAMMAQEMPYHMANDMVPNRDEELRRLQGGANFVMPLDYQFVNSVAVEFVDYVVKNNIPIGSMLMFEVLPYRKIMEVPAEATAFPSRGNFYHCSTMFTWRDETMDSNIRLFARELLNKFREKGYQGEGGQYNNYDSEDKDPKRAFGDNLARLRILKRKYDPNNVFWKWQNLWSNNC